MQNCTQMQHSNRFRCSVPHHDMQVPTGYITSLKAHAHTSPLPSAAGVAAVVRLGHGPHRAALRLHLPRHRPGPRLRGGGCGGRGRVRGVQHHPSRDRPEPAPAVSVSVPGRHAHIRRAATQDPGPPAPARRRRRTQHQRPQEATDAYHLMAADSTTRLPGCRGRAPRRDPLV